MREPVVPRTLRVPGRTVSAGRPSAVGSPGRRPFYLVPKIRCENNVSSTL